MASSVVQYPLSLARCECPWFFGAEVRTLLRPIVAGLTLNWLPDTTQTISMGDYELGIPAHWETTMVWRIGVSHVSTSDKLYAAAERHEGYATAGHELQEPY
jgi:hypothetical protein